jgi:predicted MPP superfamily phosphohydrolase
MTSSTPSTAVSTTEPSDTVKTRILIISDTHSATIFPPGKADVPFREPLPKADVLLHCGDLTMIGQLHEYEKTLELLAGIDAPLKLVIAGNHDISLDKEYWDRRGQHMHRLKEPDPSVHEKAKELWKGDAAKNAGVTYLEEGVHSFTLANGAKLRVRTQANLLF